MSHLSHNLLRIYKIIIVTFNFCKDRVCSVYTIKTCKITLQHTSGNGRKDKSNKNNPNVLELNSREVRNKILHLCSMFSRVLWGLLIYAMIRLIQVKVNIILGNTVNLCLIIVTYPILIHLPLHHPLTINK